MKLSGGKSGSAASSLGLVARRDQVVEVGHHAGAHEAAGRVEERLVVARAEGRHALRRRSPRTPPPPPRGSRGTRERHEPVIGDRVLRRGPCRTRRDVDRVGMPWAPDAGCSQHRERVLRDELGVARSRPGLPWRTHRSRAAAGSRRRAASWGCLLPSAASEGRSSSATSRDCSARRPPGWSLRPLDDRALALVTMIQVTVLLPGVDLDLEDELLVPRRPRCSWVGFGWS